MSVGRPAKLTSAQYAELIAAHRTYLEHSPKRLAQRFNISLRTLREYIGRRPPRNIK